MNRTTQWYVGGVSCSAEQIIDELGLGKGHLKFGLSLSALRSWVDQT